MPYLNRFSGTIRGNISFCGNSLGLSKLANENKKGDVGSIGTFKSINYSDIVNDYSNYTTLDYLDNASYSILYIPIYSKILYAEVFWGGLCKTNSQDVTSLLDNAIHFRNPSTSLKLNPDSDTHFDVKFTNNDKTCQYYLRTHKDSGVIYITVNAIGCQYYLRGIPGVMTANDDDTQNTNHLGWGIVAVYENENEIYRNINVWLGAEIVGPQAEKSMLFEANNIITASDGNTKANVFVFAGEGDADISGDKLQIEKDKDNLVDLSGSNNPSNNFFCSQVNDITGNISIKSLPNHDSFNNQNVEAGVQGWDSTSVHTEIQTVPGQTNLVLNFKTDGDMYIPYCVGLSIDLNEHPDITITKSSNKSFVTKNEEITFTFVIKNTGNKETLSFIFKDELNSSLCFVNCSLTINGVVSNLNPVTGFDLGCINPNQEIIISFKAVVL